MAFEKVAQLNAFSNDKEGNSNRPDYSNGKCNILTDIPQGEYSLGIWKTDRGLSIKIERRTDDVDLSSNPETTGDGDDFIDQL